MIALVKRRARALVPLATRMRVAAWLTRQQWLPIPDHVAMGLIRDLQYSDAKLYHKFVWANHFKGYARWYDSEEELFDPAQMQASRIEFFRDLAIVLDEQRIAPAEIKSVLDVGSSQGYVLRHLETEVFTLAELVGIDIDEPAIRKGARVLAEAGSRIRLVAGDMEHLDALVGPRHFDFVFAAGVLSYLNEDDAMAMVRSMLSRADRLVALVGLACLEKNNNQLDRSQLSPTHESQWIHNFEAMVVKAGGRVVYSRWEGAKLFNLQTICFVFAVPR